MQTRFTIEELYGSIETRQQRVDDFESGKMRRRARAERKKKALPRLGGAKRGPTVSMQCQRQGCTNTRHAWQKSGKLTRYCYDCNCAMRKRCRKNYPGMCSKCKTTPRYQSPTSGTFHTYCRTCKNAGANASHRKHKVVAQ
jgi:hypothetical protein